MAKYKFIKNSSLQIPKGMSVEEYNSLPYGEEYIYEPNENVLSFYHFSGSSMQNDDYKILRSIKNTINYYSAQDEIINYDSIDLKPSLLLSFNSYYLGSGIEPGSVYMELFISGSSVSKISDKLSDMVLYDSDNNKYGFILYKEGFIIINNTSSLSDVDYKYSTNYEEDIIDKPRWTNSFSKASEYVYFDMKYSLKNEINVNTYFINIKKNELNHSNNSTYIKSGSYWSLDNNTFFIENDKIEIKNTVKSPFVSGSANFEKQTFITSIGLFDEDKKLIAQANLANPVRKTEEREFLFKLKLDI